MSEQDDKKRSIRMVVMGPEGKLVDVEHEAPAELVEVLDRLFSTLGNAKRRLLTNSIHTEFGDFLRAATASQEITKAQHVGMKMSFYAGAMTLMGMFEAASEELEEEDAARRMSDLRKEITAFFKVIPQQFEDPTQPPLTPEKAKEEEDAEEEETRRRQLEALKMMPKEFMGEA